MDDANCAIFLGYFLGSCQVICWSLYLRPSKKYKISVNSVSKIIKCINCPTEQIRQGLEGINKNKSDTKMIQSDTKLIQSNHPKINKITEHILDIYEHKTALLSKLLDYATGDDTTEEYVYNDDKLRVGKKDKLKAIELALKLVLAIDNKTSNNDINIEINKVSSVLESGVNNVIDIEQADDMVDLQANNVFRII